MKFPTKSRSVWRVFTRRIAPYALVLAVIGFFGAPLVLDYIAHRIEADLQQQTETLRQRVAKQLANMTVTTEDFKSQAQTAQTELANLYFYAQEFNKLQPQYESSAAQVHSDEAKVKAVETQLGQRANEVEDFSSQIQQVNQQVGVMTNSVSSAQQLALGSQPGVTNLGNAFASWGPSQPILLGGPSPLLGQDGSLTGLNLGDTKGKVYVQVPDTSAFPQLVLSGQTTPSPLDGHEVVSWTDKGIALHLSDATFQKIRSEEAQLPEEGQWQGAVTTTLQNPLPQISPRLFYVQFYRRVFELVLS
jgi:hypothetical protein